MKASDFKTHEPEKYYEPTSDKKIEVLNNPLKFADFIPTVKWDGEWCRIISTEEETIAQGRSISVKTKTYTDKTAAIPHIIKEFEAVLPKETVVLGELCFNDPSKTSKDVGAILRCKSDKAISRQMQNGYLSFKIFDCLMYDGLQLSNLEYGERLAFFLKQFDKCSGFEYIAKPTIVNLADINERTNEIWKCGGEGLVLHNKYRKYQPGTRPSAGSIKIKKKLGLLKCKVVGILEPTKLYTGSNPESHDFILDGELVTKPYYFGWKSGVEVELNNSLIRVSSGLDDETRAWLSTNEAVELVREGKLFANITGMEITESGSIRHPQIINFQQER